jgi:hypothetical protein
VLALDSILIFLVKLDQYKVASSNHMIVDSHCCLFLGAFGVICFLDMWVSVPNHAVCCLGGNHGVHGACVSSFD